jgi:hypothetical protein
METSVKNSVKTMLKWHQKPPGVKRKVFKMSEISLVYRIPPSLLTTIKALRVSALMVINFDAGVNWRQNPEVAAMGLLINKLTGI